MSEMEKQPELSAEPAERQADRPKSGKKDAFAVRLAVELVVLLVALVAVCVVGELKKPDWWVIVRANFGSPAMQYELGGRYANFDDPDHDLKKAEKWLVKADKNGHPDAALLMADITAAEKDKQMWLTRAAEKGNVKAQYQLGMVYSRNDDYAAAFAWYEKAAEGGMREAQHLVAGCYRNGIGVKTDAEKAKAWYEKAAAQGYGPSETMLEEMASKKE